MSRLNLESLTPGILKLGYKLLVNDRAKFIALLVGMTFAVFLMIEMTSLFSGAMYRASATVINIGAKVWVMDPAVQTVANTIPLPDYVLDEVRSIPGVKYAVPLYSGGALVKLRRWRLINRSTSLASTIPACSAGRRFSKGTSTTSLPKTGFSSSRTPNSQAGKSENRHGVRAQ